jgi:hypothetical protein
MCVIELYSELLPGDLLMSLPTMYFGGSVLKTEQYSICFSKVTIPCLDSSLSRFELITDKGICRFTTENNSCYSAFFKKI